MNMADFFISLSSEYPSILGTILLIFGAAGVLISSSAVLDIMRAGRRDSHGGTNKAVLAKMLGGAGLIDLAFWAGVWTDTIWSKSASLDIPSMAVEGSSGYAGAAISAAIGIMVITGYVTLGRAYLKITKLGYATDDARGDLIGAILSRIVAGSALIASMHFAGVIESTMQSF